MDFMDWTKLVTIKSKIKFTIKSKIKHETKFCAYISVNSSLAKKSKPLNLFSFIMRILQKIFLFKIVTEKKPLKTIKAWNFGKSELLYMYFARTFKKLAVSFTWSISEQLFLKSYFFFQNTSRGFFWIDVKLLCSTVCWNTLYLSLFEWRGILSLWLW